MRGTVLEDSKDYAVGLPLRGEGDREVFSSNHDGRVKLDHRTRVLGRVRAPTRKELRIGTQPQAAARASIRTQAPGRGGFGAGGIADHETSGGDRVPDHPEVGVGRDGVAPLRFVRGQRERICALDRFVEENLSVARVRCGQLREV